MDSIDDDTCLRCNETKGLNSRVLMRKKNVVGLVRLCDEHDIDEEQGGKFTVTLAQKNR